MTSTASAPIKYERESDRENPSLEDYFTNPVSNYLINNSKQRATNSIRRIVQNNRKDGSADWRKIDATLMGKLSYINDLSETEAYFDFALALDAYSEENSFRDPNGAVLSELANRIRKYAIQAVDNLAVLDVLKGSSPQGYLDYSNTMIKTMSKDDDYVGLSKVADRLYGVLTLSDRLNTKLNKEVRNNIKLTSNKAVKEQAYASGYKKRPITLRKRIANAKDRLTSWIFKKE